MQTEDRESSKRLAKEAAAWVASPEGQKAIAEALAKAHVETEEIRLKMRSINWKSWTEPMI